MFYILDNIEKKKYLVFKFIFYKIGLNWLIGPGFCVGSKGQTDVAEGAYSFVMQK